MKYVRRHWKGELPLAISFWVNFALVNLIIHLLGYWLRISPFFDHPVLASRLAIGFVLGTVLVVYPWQFVGVWRSASRYRPAGKQFWGSIVKVTLIANLLWAAVTTVRTWPVYREMFLVGFTSDRYADFEVRLTDNGRYLRIRGTLGFGVSDQVAKFLSKPNEIVGIILDSEGGRVYEGEKIAEIVFSNGLETSSNYGCYSACTIAFLAGKKRILGAEARLGFHRYSSNSGDTGAGRSNIRMQLENERYKFRRAGITDDFIDRVLATPADHMWFPSDDELISAGVVDDLVGRPTENESNRTERLLAQSPAIRSIKAHDKDKYDEIAKKINEEILAGANAGQIDQIISDYVDAAILEALPMTSDSAVMRYIVVNNKLLQKLNTVNPKVCMKYILPEKYGRTRVSDYLSSDDLELLFDALGIILTDRYESPVLEIRRDEAREVFERALMNVGNRAHYLQGPQLGTPKEYSSACSAFVDFYESILAENPSAASNALRAVFSPQ